MIAELRTTLSERSLSERPIGIVFTGKQILEGEAIFANGLDWVGIEAYVDPPGDPDPEVNVATLTAFVQAAKARVPADKNLVLVMQAYDRNGLWTDMATLARLQAAAYDLARDDPRVLSLNMFAYGRPGGTHDHPELRHEHLLIGEKVLGPEHPQVAAGIVDLASLYRAQSRFAQAEPLYQWALTLQRKALGPDHPEVADSLDEYALLLKQTNRDAEAADLQAQAKAIRAKAPAGR